MKAKHLSGRMMATLTAMLLVCLLSGGVAAVDNAMAGDKPTITIGWTAWVENEAAKEVARQILEKELNYNVELKLSDMGVISEGLKSGSIDVFLELCLPYTHKDYWDRIGGEVVAAGMFYDQLVQGWAVPNYVPKGELNSILDMQKPDVKTKLDGKIIGIEAGSGLMRQSKTALDSYQLSDYELVTSSEPAMVASLDKAIKKKEWVVVTLWKPHFAWAQWDLRMLSDPDQVIGQFNSCHIVVHKDLMNRCPDAYGFFARFYWGIPLIGEMLYDMGIENMSAEEAAAKFIKEHPDRVRYWATGKMD